GHDARAPALRGPTHVQRDEEHRPRPPARRREPGRQPLAGLSPRVLPAELAWGGECRGAGLRLGPGFLHHAGAAGRSARRLALDADRATGQRPHQLGPRVRAGGGAARADPARPDRLPALPRDRGLVQRGGGPVNGRRDGSAGADEWDIARLALYTLTGLILLFLLLPMFVIVPISFSSAKFLTFPPPGWSLQWYEKYFTSPA